MTWLTEDWRCGAFCWRGWRLWWGVAQVPALAQSLNITENLPGGVIVDPQGVLRQKALADDRNGELAAKKAAAAKTNLGRDWPPIARSARCRSIAWKRPSSITKGRSPTRCSYLAGLLRVRYVFYYPESKDIVLAGPAEGWLADPAGRAVGLTSGRPVVQLQDLVVALRAFPPGKPGQRVIGCSIDPTPEGLAAMQRFLRATGGQATPADTQYIVNGLRASLGLQTVTINGVSPKTNFAADPGGGRLPHEAHRHRPGTPPVHLVSFVERANPAQVSNNALFRWYFVPDYQCVRVSDDNLAMELVGDGVKLVGEDELVGAGGGRQAAASRGNRASQAFVLSFTKKYAELAERSPVYAELRNVIDLSVVAAYIQQQDYYGKAGWTMPVLGNEKSFAVEIQNAPQQVESAVAAIWKGNRLTTPIGGGVHIRGQRGGQTQPPAGREGQSVEAPRGNQLHLAEGQWWWD